MAGNSLKMERHQASKSLAKNSHPVFGKRPHLQLPSFGEFKFFYSLLKIRFYGFTIPIKVAMKIFIKLDMIWPKEPFHGMIKYKIGHKVEANLCKIIINSEKCSY